MAPPAPPPLRRAEPLVNAAGQPSPALPTPVENYTFLRTIPRRHRSLRDRVDKVGSHLRKWLARAKSFSLPPARPALHHPHRSREYEDINVRDYAETHTHAHRRTVSASDFGTRLREESGSLKGPRRPSTLTHTTSHRSGSTPRVVEEDEPPYVPESPSAVRPDSSNTSPRTNTSPGSHTAAPGIVLSPTSDTNLPLGTPYIPDAVQHSASLFALDELGSSSGGTCEQTPRSGDGTVSLPEVESSLPSRTGSSAAVGLVSNAGVVAVANAANINGGETTTATSAAAPTPTPKHELGIDLNSPSARPTYVNPSAPLHALDSPDEHLEPIVPALLVQGTPLLKVTPKKTRQKFFRLDADQGLVTWESEKAGIIYIENIKEIRIGEQARYYREQFKIAAEREDRWMTIVYTSDNKYKILHVIAFSRETALLWHRTLTSLRALRRNVMSGLVSPARMWERHYWRGADMSRDERLEIEEVERLCRRLNVAIGKKDLVERFKSADKGSKGYLDFSDFQQFVKTLQARPEVKRLWNRMRGDGLFDLEVFGNFLREEQKCDFPPEQIKKIFDKYASGGVEQPLPPPADGPDSPRASTSTRPISPIRMNTSPPGSRPSSPSPTPRRSSSISRKARSRSGSRTRSTAAHALGKLIPSALGNKVAHSAAGPGSPTVCSYPDKQHSIAAGLAPTTLLATPPPPHFTLDDFSAFLLSAENSAFGDVHHDMNRPLSDYYISSSHNTYLVGHQLVGESTIEGYIRALGSGCRSVEVDIWDGDHEPVITHGRTLTGSVPLRHVAHAIAKYAFVASPYPVIISAEMHAGIEQQSMVAAIFKEAFGPALVTAPLEGSAWSGPGDLDELDELPSPEALRGRVLVKFKNALLSEVEVEVDGEVEEESESATTDTESIKDLGRALSLAKRVRHSFRANKRPDPRDFSPSMSPSNTLMLDPSAALVPSSPPSSTVLSAPPMSPPRKKQRAYSNRSEIERPRLKMSRSLADLLIYTVGVKFRGLNKKERYGVEQMFSLSEKTANKLTKENALGLVKHCRSNLVRLYPNGTRVTSTNYEPSRYWATGVQLVAINWQTIDLGNMMNQSMFQRNARAGYLLKPEVLRIKDKELLTRRTDYVLEITIISAQQIPRRRDENGREIMRDSIMDPLVEVSLHVPDWPTAPVQDQRASGDKREGGKGADRRTEGGKSSDKRGEGRGGVDKRTYRTTAVKNNGFNPVWEESVSIPFTCVGDMWDLIFVRFAVLDDDDDDEPLAMHCASLGSLRKGYRHLPLHDLQFSQYLFSTLFVHVALRQA